MQRDRGPYNLARSTWAQVCAMTALYLTSVNVAMMIGMPVLVVGALGQGGNGALSLTQEQASWLGGVGFIVQPLGSVISGFSQDTLGRKTCLILGIIPEVIGWLVLYLASSVETLFSAITLMGFSVGFMEPPLFSYIGEVSEPRLRGVLSALNSIFLNVGFVVINGLGALAEWRTVALVSTAAPVVSLTAVALIPESPMWLVSKGRVEEALKAYQWLRGWVSPQAVQVELDTLVAYVEQKRQVTCTKESKLQVFLHSSVQRPLRLIVVHFFVGACASLIAVKVFIIKVMSDLDVPAQPNVALVVCTAMTLLGTLTSTLLMRRLGKRGLTFLSLGPCVVCCLALGLYLELGLKLPWLPLGLFCVSYYSGGIGLVSVPWILISELFPLRGRGVACGVAGALGFLCYFLVIKTYFNVASMIGDSGVYFLCAFIGTLGFIYLYLYLPETEGVSLETIEKFFWKSNKTRSELVKELNPKKEELLRL